MNANVVLNFYYCSYVKVKQVTVIHSENLQTKVTLPTPLPFLVSLATPLWQNCNDTVELASQEKVVEADPS